MADITYLAGPYTKGNAEVRLARFHALTHAAAKLITAGRIVYSPITMTHPIDLALTERLSSNFWVSFDEAFIELCTAIVVLKLPGWETSSGVSREISLFEKRNITPVYLEPDTLDINALTPIFSAAFKPNI